MSRSGIAAQLGFVAESTYGTYVAPTKFVPFATESLELEIERLEGAGIRAGRATLHADDWYPGRRMVSGDIQMEAHDRTTALLFVHALGGVTTTGASAPYTHTVTPSASGYAGKSLTIQVGRPDVSGTVRPFSYLGCKVESLELSCAAGELAQLNVGIVGRDETTAQALATVSYASGLKAYTFIQGSASIGGSSVSAKSFTLNVANTLDTDRVFVGADTMSEPLMSGLTEISGTIELEFDSLTQYQRYTAGTTAAVVLTLSAGVNNSLTATLNCRFEPTAVNVGGTDVLQLSLPFKAIGSTDSAACSIAIINGDATP